jgi:hypothetical protein
MTIATFRFEPSTRISLSAAGMPAINLSAKPATSTMLREKMDPEERRWQLEWSRRNIED